MRFESLQLPETNLFWTNLARAMTDLPGDPKPSCKGFYFAYFNNNNSTMGAEKIGEVPVDKLLKYLHFAAKKLTQTLYLDAVRSKEFADDALEQYPGGVKINGFCAATSGHESMVDEAISILWLFYNFPDELCVITDNDRIQQMLLNAEKFAEASAPDNKWVTLIGKRMLN